MCKMFGFWTTFLLSGPEIVERGFEFEFEFELCWFDSLYVGTLCKDFSQLFSSKKLKASHQFCLGIKFDSLFFFLN